MGPLFTAIVAACTLTLISAQEPAKDSAAPEAVRSWLAAHRTNGTALPTELLTAAKDPARFVLVGRAFEGTSELARFQNELIGAAKKFDVVAIDVGLAEGEAIDAYIRTGKGDAAAIVATLGPWGWSAAEAKSFLETCRASPAKPAIVGIGVGDPTPLFQLLLDFLRKAHPDGVVRYEGVLDGLRVPGKGGRPRYWALDDNSRYVMRLGIEELMSILRDTPEAYIARSSAAEYARGIRILTVISQYEMTMRFERDAGDSDPRGRILAENAIAAGTKDGKPLRVLALVHVRDLARASDPDSFAAQLQAASGAKPVCVATACGGGSFLAFDPSDTGEGVREPRDLVLPEDARTPLENALTGQGEAVFDLRGLPKDGTATAWLTQRRTLRSARATCGGASETPWDYAVASDFDALVWFPSVKAASRAATSSR